MIGTIRKHSAILWWSIVPLTIISFVIFMGQGNMHGDSNPSGSMGTIYGKRVTVEDYEAAKREFSLYYFQLRGTFPERDPNFNALELKHQTYVRLLLTAKANQLGIHASDEAQANAAKVALAQFGRSLTRDGQPMPMNQFAEFLTQNGLNVLDFQRFVRDDLILQQMVESLGLPGAMVSPQEAGQLYDREHQEVAAQAVFFSATNFAAQVVASPAAVSMFYSNYMAHYRLPDRVQINYVEYNLTNYVIAAETKIGKTNIAAQAEAYYAQHPTDAVPGVTAPEEAKARLREMIVRQAAAKMAQEQAMEFVNPLFAMDPPSGDNLVQQAKKMGLTVHTTAPFTEAEGPDEFPAPAELIKGAFKLTAESPFETRPVVGAEAVYVVGLAKQVPSAVQPLEAISGRVQADLKFVEGAKLARNAGSNFVNNAFVQLAMGKTFAQVALTSGQVPVELKPFSISTEDVPEAAGRAEVNQIKQAAFSTQPGHISRFNPTQDGGFALFVQSTLPVDTTLKGTQLPEFLQKVRRSRENEAFNNWLQVEANRELRSIFAADEMAAAKPAPSSP